MRWALLLALLAAAPARAALVGELPVPQKVAIVERDVVSGKVRLDPAKGYIFQQALPTGQGLFLRVPDQDDIAAFRSDWEKGLVKAQQSYRTNIADWQRIKDNLPPDARLDERPLEPTRENFSIGPIEGRMMVLAERVYSKAPGPQYSYLSAVKPGTYVWYGAIQVMGDYGNFGSCKCMGSVKFTVKPGMVTDLGTFLVASERDPEQTPFMSDDPAEAEKIRSQYRNRPALVYGLPASLNGWPSQRAEFSAAGKIDNFLALPISRMPPVPGVLGYRRDIPIDLRTNTPITAPAMGEAQ